MQTESPSVPAAPASAVTDVLFLCTGNYYRSRFAEELFNARARVRRLPYRARSRGLDLGQCSLPVRGPVSSFVIEGLYQRGFRHRDEREPRAVTKADLAGARHVVALHRGDHWPLLFAGHPEVLERVDFWDVPDARQMPPTRALAQLARQVEDLLSSIAREECAQGA